MVLAGACYWGGGDGDGDNDETQLDSPPLEVVLFYHPAPHQPRCDKNAAVTADYQQQVCSDGLSQNVELDPEPNRRGGSGSEENEPERDRDPLPRPLT